MDSLHILYKFPTRSRPHKAKQRIEEIRAYSDSPNYTIMMSIDNDDQITLDNIELFDGCFLDIDSSPNKIHAINRNMDKAPKWDIVVVMSDDMQCQIKGFDNIIREGFREIAHTDNGDILFNTYNLDNALWFFDGWQHNICTLVVMGRTRYEKFNYLYHPDYVSLWCDNEWTDVNKPTRIDTILFLHLHPAWKQGEPMDALYQRNEAYFQHDQQTYNRRKELNFPI
jgi:hypothetical protein